MAESTIRAQIKTMMEAVSGIGIVHDQEMRCVEESAINTAFRYTSGGTTYIRGWTISLNKSTTEQILLGLSASSGRSKTWEYVIKGYAGVNDANSGGSVLYSLIDALETYFASRRTLNSTCQYHTGIMTQSIGYKKISGLVCHYCELTLTVYEYE